LVVIIVLIRQLLSDQEQPSIILYLVADLIVGISQIESFNVLVDQGVGEIVLQN